MPLFRKKPVVIEAWLYDGSIESLGPVKDAEGVLLEGERPAIKTLEGVMSVDVGDWVIRGVAGEYYPCKPAIFAQLYDPA